jgi:shikimate kinase
MKNIYLIGFMGTGKTTVGKILAKELEKRFIEMDDLIEKQEGKKISEIFEIKGEPYFRKLESEVLQGLAGKTDLVVSCGGGAVCSNKNIDLVKRTGKVFCLSASATKIYERTRNEVHRPLLEVAEPLKQIEELLAKRLPYYQQADYVIDTEGINPEKVAERIIDLMKHINSKPETLNSKQTRNGKITRLKAV